jgi:ferritin-like metal-binding protein YciE
MIFQNQSGLATTLDSSLPIFLKRSQKMKFFSANLETLRGLYRNQLRMLLSTEDQIIEALPTMIEKATDVQLKQAFQSHLQETRVHKTRLQEILNDEVQKADPIKCNWRRW